MNVDGKDEGAVTKDALEEKLHWLVISGQLDLNEAQEAIATDWLAAYRKYCGEFPVFSFGA